MTYFLGGGSIIDVPITATGSTTGRALPERFAEIINVKDFGAVGDGVTNDTAAIQRAIDHLAIRIATTAPTSAGNATLTFGANLTTEMENTINNYHRFPFVSNLTDPATLNTAAVIQDATDTTLIVENSAHVVGTIETGDIIEVSIDERGMIFFPLGRYLVTGTLSISTSVRYFELVGAAGATIIGNFNAPIINRGSLDAVNPLESIASIRTLRVINEHTTGTGIEITGCTALKITSCYVVANKAINVLGTQCATIDTCKVFFPGGSTLSGSFGIAVGNAAVCLDNDVTGFEWGIVHCNLGLVISGGRMEGNSRAVMIGWDIHDNSSFQSNGVMIQGLSMENNVVGIYLHDAGSVVVSGCAATTGGAVTPNIGIYVGAVNDILIQGVACTGTFITAGIRIAGGTRITVDSTTSDVWSVSQIFSLQLRNTNCPLLTFSQLPTVPVAGTILSITDGATTAIGVQCTAGSSTNDYVLCAAYKASAPAIWIRIA